MREAFFQELEKVDTLDLLGQEFYDRLYCAHTVEKQDDLNIVKEIVESGDCGDILEFGAGFGRVSLFLANEGRNVTAIEKHERYTDLGKALSQRLGLSNRIYWIDANFVDSLPSGMEQRYSHVVCVHNTINEVQDQIAEFFNNARKALTNQGRLIVRALSAIPYERRGLVELQGAFQIESDFYLVSSTSQLCTNSISTSVVLYLIYEKYNNGQLAAKYLRSLKRRIWTKRELAHFGKQAGMLLLDCDSDENWYVFEKM